MELLFLGRGSAFNVKEGNTSAFIKENKTLLLIDCGSTVFKEIIQKDILKGVNNVYVMITHMHPDHIGSLGDLIFYCFYKLNKIIKIISVDKRKITDFLKIQGINNNMFDFLSNKQNYIPELSIKIIPVVVRHVQEINSVGYIIKKNNSQIFYSGDCYYINWGNLNCDRYYVDTCNADYEGNVHYNLCKLNKDIRRYGISPSKIYCMHFDCREAIIKALEFGFNIVEEYNGEEERKETN